MKTEKVAVTTNNKTNGGSNMKGFFEAIVFTLSKLYYLVTSFVLPV